MNGACHYKYIIIYFAIACQKEVATPRFHTRVKPSVTDLNLFLTNNPESRTRQVKACFNTIQSQQPTTHTTIKSSHREQTTVHPANEQTMESNNSNTVSAFLEALESLKQARLVTHSFMTHEHQFKGLTEAEQNSLQNSITPFFNAIFEIEDRILSWYREFHPELSDDDDLIESIEKDHGYETLLSEKGKLDLEKLFREDN